MLTYLHQNTATLFKPGGLFQVDNTCQKHAPNCTINNIKMQKALTVGGGTLPPFVHVIWMSWPVASVRCPSELAKPHPVIWTLYRVDVHIGGSKGLVRYNSRSKNDGSTIVLLYVVSVYDVHITNFHRISIRVLYETFHTFFSTSLVEGRYIWHLDVVTVDHGAVLWGAPRLMSLG